MDNKLSELSKPVAWKLHHHDRYYFEENADVVAIAESMGQAKGDAVYSQEYVSALKHESAVNWEAAASLNVENQELKKRITGLERHVKDIEATLIAATDEIADLTRERDEARAKLATPVRLPLLYSPDPWMSPDPDGTWLDKEDVKKSIRAAGFTVEGDE